MDWKAVSSNRVQSCNSLPQFYHSIEIQRLLTKSNQVNLQIRVLEILSKLPKKSLKQIAAQIAFLPFFSRTRKAFLSNCAPVFSKATQFQIRR